MRSERSNRPHPAIRLRRGVRIVDATILGERAYRCQDVTAGSMPELCAELLRLGVPATHVQFWDTLDGVRVAAFFTSIPSTASLAAAVALTSEQAAT